MAGSALMFLVFGGVVAVGSLFGVLALGTRFGFAHVLLLAGVYAAWRVWRVGLYVSDRGVRVQWMWRRVTLSWEEITGFEASGLSPVPEIVILTSTAGPVATPLKRRFYRLLWGGQAGGGVTRRDVMPTAFDDLLRRLQEQRERTNR